MGWKTKLLITIVLPILVGKILDPSHVVRTRDFAGKILKKVLARFDGLWEDETMLKAREINKTPCCSVLRVSGTEVDDPWYRDIMGDYSIYPALPYINYEKQPLKSMNGDFPLYEHTFQNFTPTEYKPNPPKSYLYYYINENPKYPEVECKEKGCWIISMYDPTPGNFWFGKKWYYVKTEDVFKCPDDLTASGDNVFVNNQGKKEPKLKIECL